MIMRLDFFYNTVETKRIELLGLSQWNGMNNEITFNEGISWISRPLLNSIYGRYKTAEAFSQYFLTGYMKGELYGGEFERVKKASDFANNVVTEAIDNNYNTEWIERHISQLIKILELDPLSSIPILAPRTRIGMAMSQSDLIKQLQKLVSGKNKSKDDKNALKEIIEGNDVLSEFETLLKESKKTENKGYESLENFGLSVPEIMDR